jgi:anthranilate/para-aminobenzoate synthase component I
MDEPGFVWFDSALQDHPRSFSSFCAEEPAGELVLRDDRLVTSGVADQFSHCGNSLYNALEAIYDSGRYVAGGFISYEAMLGSMGISVRNHPVVPLAHFYLYDGFSSDLSRPRNQGADGTLVLSEAEGSAAHGLNSSTITNQISRDDYFAKIQRIKEYIREGDIYQANFTSLFDVSSLLHPADVYHRLRQSNPASHCTFLNFGEYQILSSSPERMFRLEGDRIITNPIKGTIRRTGDPFEDSLLAETLLNSQKNLAELLMIVDLERNDLGRIAKTGSVTVDCLRRIESYSSLIHLVAQVSASVREDCRLAEILAALLPGGSITGAPKRRAIEIIAKLESAPRSVYTGCIGYLDGRNRVTEFNIAIRTMTHYDGRYEIHAGGGIVADSTAEEEYDEMMLKASRMLSAVGIERNQ